LGESNGKYRIRNQSQRQGGIIEGVAANELQPMGKAEQDGDQRKIKAFQTALAARNLQMHDVDGDGNCLYRAISYFFSQGTQKYHGWYRLQALDYILTHRPDLVKRFPNGKFEADDVYLAFIAEHTQDKAFGADEMLWALSQRFNLRINVFHYSHDHGFGLSEVAPFVPEVHRRTVTIGNLLKHFVYISEKTEEQVAKPPTPESQGKGASGNETGSNDGPSNTSSRKNSTGSSNGGSRSESEGTNSVIDFFTSSIMRFWGSNSAEQPEPSGKGTSETTTKGKPSVPSPSPAPGAQEWSDWSCGRCTTRNPALASVCGVCYRGKRPSIAD